MVELVDTINSKFIAYKSVSVQIRLKVFNYISSIISCKIEKNSLINIKLISSSNKSVTSFKIKLKVSKSK
jgi:hypothetical protein